MTSLDKNVIVQFDDDRAMYCNGSWGQRFLEKTLKKRLNEEALQVRSATSVLEWEHMFTAGGKPRLYLCDHDISSLEGNEEQIFQFVDPLLFAIKNDIYAVIYSGSGEDYIRHDIEHVIDGLHTGALCGSIIKNISPNYHDIWAQKGEQHFFHAHTGFYSPRELLALKRIPVVEKGDTEHLLFHVKKSMQEKLRFVL